MKPNSILYLAIPDKDYTFDKKRKLTTWEHLYQEYKQKTTILSDEHLKEFSFAASKTPRKLAIKHLFPWIRKKIYDHHRERSIHVHVWDQESFDYFLTRGIKKLNLSFEILDSVTSQQTNHESIYILKKY